MNKKYLISSILVILLLVMGIIFFMPSNKIVLIVGTEAPPHSFTQNNEISGITVELIKIIFNKLDVDYEIKLIPWDDAINEMKTGKADAIMDAIPTKERMQFLMIAEEDLYSKDKEGIATRWTENIVAAYKMNSDIEIETKEDLEKKDYRIGIVNGYFYLRFDFSKYDIYSYKDSSALIHGLDDGEIDLAIIPELEARGVINSDGLIDIKLSPGLFNSHYLVHLSFSKIRNTKYLSELKKQVEHELILLKQSGEYDIIYNKYLGEI